LSPHVFVHLGTIAILHRCTQVTAHTHYNSTESSTILTRDISYDKITYKHAPVGCKPLAVQDTKNIKYGPTYVQFLPTYLRQATRSSRSLDIGSFDNKGIVFYLRFRPLFKGFRTPFTRYVFNFLYMLKHIFTTRLPPGLWIEETAY
jgi:hypothetical protein